MRFLLCSLCLAGAVWASQTTASPGAAASVEERTLVSQVLGGSRAYRIFLPPSYTASQKRFPVIYWLYGYEQANPEREREISSYVAAHDVLVVLVGPVETTGEYPMYFPELVDHIDRAWRTLADRDHRAVTGYSMGGFLAFYTAGKYPDLVASASSFLGAVEAPVGPRGFEVDYRLHELYANYDGVRTRLVADPRDPARFYHQRLNDLWLFARSAHETVDFDRAHADAAIPEAFDFHLHAFAAPPAKPASFSHADAYPNFDVWGWQAASNRRQPGFTVLEHVSPRGFRSSVREWSPDGAIVPYLKLSLESPRLYAPGSSHVVTYTRLADGQVRRASQRADAQGRLSFDLSGEAYEVAIGEEPEITIAGWTLDGAAWATAGRPVKLHVQLRNAGASRSLPGTVRWESPNPGVKVEPASARLFEMNPGETVPSPLTVTVSDPARAVLRLTAVIGTRKIDFVVPLFPPAAPAAQDSSFEIADGREVTAWRRAVEKATLVFGDGNRDGQAAPGETFVVLLKDGDALRPAELFTTDACLDTGVRGADSWDYFDHQQASMPYTVAQVRADCQPGHVIHALARIVSPGSGGYQTRCAAVEFPVWWRRGEEPKGTAGK